MSNKQQNIEFLAHSFRRENGLSDTEPIRIKSMLLKNKVITLYKPLSSGFSGMSFIIPIKEKPIRFLLVNSNDAIGRQHFTICHELYHLYCQKNFTHSVSYNTGAFDQKHPEEYNADLFATSLLLPKNGVLELIPENERAKNKIQISTIVAIEQYYSISHQALLFRLLNMDLIDKAYKDSIVNGIKNIALRYGYDISLYEKGNEGVIIGDYGELAYKAWDKGIISENMYYSLMEDIGIDLSKLSQNNGNEQ
jgi:Zn-dependent peptidase ImmA (M78 family)